MFSISKRVVIVVKKSLLFVIFGFIVASSAFSMKKKLELKDINNNDRIFYFFKSLLLEKKFKLCKKIFGIDSSKEEEELKKINEEILSEISDHIRAIHNDRDDRGCLGYLKDFFKVMAEAANESVGKINNMGFYDEEFIN